MKICIAQTKPIKGDISSNIEAHIRFIEGALTFNSEAIFFPELSLTGYEPELAKDLAIHPNDNRLDVFQQISNNSKIIIGLGIPVLAESQIRISMVIFEPYKEIQIYSKQQLHSDELPYFESGVEQVIIKAKNTHIAPAICFESLKLEHAEKAYKSGANVYLASVAKPANGVEKALNHYPQVAKQYGMPVLMTNCVGFCDNFLSVGQSSVWTKDGILVGQLDDKTEAILVYDTENEIVNKALFN